MLGHFEKNGKLESAWLGQLVHKLVSRTPQKVNWSFVLTGIIYNLYVARSRIKKKLQSRYQGGRAQPKTRVFQGFLRFLALLYLKENEKNIFSFFYLIQYGHRAKCQFSAEKNPFLNPFNQLIYIFTKSGRSRSWQDSEMLHICQHLLIFGLVPFLESADIFF